MQSTRDGPPPSTASEDELADYLKKLCSDVTLVTNKEGFFVHWVDQISAYISEDFVQRFGKLSSDYARIQMAWRIKPVHSLKVERLYRAKDEAESVRLREQGNEAFKKRSHQQALLLYSQAVMRAPHTGSSLCLAYGNRSAALCQSEQFRWCLRDIRHALVHGYPHNLRYKILERAGHCYQKLQLPQSASHCYRRAKAALTSSGLDRDKLESWLANMDKKITECEAAAAAVAAKGGGAVEVTREDGEDILLSDPENSSVSDWKGVGEAAPAPALYHGSNPALPSASAAVTLRSSQDTGRSVVAGADVPPGAVLVDEKPHAVVLAGDKRGAYCTHCCRRLVSSVPCPDCCGVAYCSQQCCQLADQYHRWECPFLDLLNGSGMSLNGFLALRIIAQQPLEYFLKLRSELEKTTNLLQPEETNCTSATPTQLHLPTASRPHDPTSYLSVYHTVGLEEHRPPLDFLQRTLMAVLLLKVLQRAGYFGAWDHCASPDADATDQQLYVGALLLRNLQVLQFNAHEVLGMTFLSDTPAFKRSKALPLGLAVYPTVAFFNHSCYPGVTRYFVGSRMVMCAVRGVKAGEPIEENYGPVFTHHTREARQRKLLSRYWFKCACVACSTNWGTYPELKSTLTLKCPHCSSPLPAPPQLVDPVDKGSKKKGGPGPGFICPKCKKQLEFEQMTADMVESQKLYISGQAHMDAGRREAAISDLEQYISRCQQHAHLPHKDLHLAMEAVRVLVAGRGTCAVVVMPTKN